MAEVRERRDFNTHTHTSMQNTVPRSFRPIVTLVDCSNESSHNAPSPAEGKPQNKLDNYLLIAPWVYESCHLGKTPPPPTPKVICITNIFIFLFYIEEFFEKRIKKYICLSDKS